MFCRSCQRIRWRNNDDVEKWFGSYIVYHQLGLPASVTPESSELLIFGNKNTKQSELYKLVKKAANKDIFHGWQFKKMDVENVGIVVKFALVLDLVDFTVRGNGLKLLIKK